MGSAPKPNPVFRIALVDADLRIAEAVKTALQAVGFETERYDLADFPNGESAMATLVAFGVDAIVYDLGERYEQHRSRFEEFYASILEHATPLLLTTFVRWTEEEQAAQGDSGAHASPAVARLVRLVQRELRAVPVARGAHGHHT